MNMSLYDRINELQGARPLGSVLDAGTGRGSIRWLLEQNTEHWTAVTGSARMAEMTRLEIGARMRPQDRVVVGNWIEPELLAGECYDTVLADYLLGAIEGFAPYWQDRIFERLRPLVGKRLYVIGLEPYVMQIPDEPTGRIVAELGRLRDACLLLGGERPYREYPLEWVLRNLGQSGFRILDAHRIAIRYGERFIDSQLDMCTRTLGKLKDRQLAVALQRHVAELRCQALALCHREGGLRHGHDYIVVAEPGCIEGKPQ
jgi:hypothetical protein